MLALPFCESGWIVEIHLAEWLFNPSCFHSVTAGCRLLSPYSPLIKDWLWVWMMARFSPLSKICKSHVANFIFSTSKGFESRMSNNLAKIFRNIKSTNMLHLIMPYTCQNNNFDEGFQRICYCSSLAPVEIYMSSMIWQCQRPFYFLRLIQLDAFCHIWRGVVSDWFRLVWE